MRKASGYRPRVLARGSGLEPAPWVAINNYNKKQVIDIDHGVMEDGRRLLSFPWNGGTNQWWRLEDA